MSFMVSEEVMVKEGGLWMIVIGYFSGMVECCWYDGYGVKWEVFYEIEFVLGEGSCFVEEVWKGIINIRLDYIWSGVLMFVMNDSCVLLCYYYKIIVVLWYVIVRLC